MLSYNNNLNRSCLNLKDTYSSDEKTLPMDQAIGVKLTTNASGSYKEVNCWFPTGSNSAYEGNKSLLTACNDGSDIYACRAALRGDLNIYWCEGWREEGFTDGVYKLFYKGYTNPQVHSCDMTKSPAWTLMYSTTKAGSYTVPYSADYRLVAAGGGAGYLRSAGLLGGIASGSKNISSGTKVTVSIALGGNGGSGHGSPYICTGVGRYAPSGGKGGSGISISVGSSSHVIVAGGAGGGAAAGAGGGGGGWGAGGGGASTYKDGGWYGSAGSAGTSFSSDSTITGGAGGKGGGRGGYGGVGGSGGVYGGVGGVSLYECAGGGGGGGGRCTLSNCTTELAYGITRVDSPSVSACPLGSSSYSPARPQAGVYIIGTPSNWTKPAKP